MERARAALTPAVREQLRRDLGSAVRGASLIWLVAAVLTLLYGTAAAWATGSWNATLLVGLVVTGAGVIGLAVAALALISLALSLNWPKDVDTDTDTDTETEEAADSGEE